VVVTAVSVGGAETGALVAAVASGGDVVLAAGVAVVVGVVVGVVVAVVPEDDCRTGESSAQAASAGPMSRKATTPRILTS
jgi:hypothetical protein